MSSMSSDPQVTTKRQFCCYCVVAGLCGAFGIALLVAGSHLVRGIQCNHTRAGNTTTNDSSRTFVTLLGGVAMILFGCAFILSSILSGMFARVLRLQSRTWDNDSLKIALGHAAPARTTSVSSTDKNEDTTKHSIPTPLL
ncbi:hypothetical protein SprV_0902728700 [Sparganum proliferum]